MLARVAVRSGLVGHANPKALAVGAQQLLKGRAGLSAIFRLRGISDAHRPALVHAGQVRTYGEVDARIDRLATGLLRFGLKPRDSAALLLWNRPEFFEVESAMARIGASAVRPPLLSTAAELEYPLNHAAVRAVFFESALWSTPEDALRACPNIPPHPCIALGDNVISPRVYNSLLHI